MKKEVTITATLVIEREDQFEDIMDLLEFGNNEAVLTVTDNLLEFSVDMEEVEIKAEN